MTLYFTLSFTLCVIETSYSTAFCRNRPSGPALNFFEPTRRLANHFLGCLFIRQKVFARQILLFELSDNRTDNVFSGRKLHDISIYANALRMSSSFSGLPASRALSG